MTCHHCGAPMRNTDPDFAAYEHTPWVHDHVFYCDDTCFEAAEGPIEVDPARDTIACVLSVEIAAGER